MAGQADTASSQQPLDIDRWRRAIREDTFSNYHYEMGIALRRQGETADAIAAFQRALAAKPNRAEASLALAEVLEETGRSEEARAVRHAAAALDSDFELTGSLARIEDAAGREDVDLSPTVVATVERLAPQLVRPLILAARAFRNVGRHKQASAWCAKAVTLNPEEARRSELEFVLVGKAGTVHNLADRLRITVSAEADRHGAAFFLGQPSREAGLLTATVWLRVLRGRVMLSLAAKGERRPFVSVAVEPSADVIPVDLPVLADADFRQIDIYNVTYTPESSELEIHGVLVRTEPMPPIASPADAVLLRRQMLAANALQLAGQYGDAQRYIAAVPGDARLAAARNNLYLFGCTPSGSVEATGDHLRLRGRDGGYVYVAAAELGQPAHLPCTVIVTVFLRVLKGLGGVWVIARTPGPQSKENEQLSRVSVEPSKDVVAVELRVDATADFGQLILLASGPAHKSAPPAEIELYGFLVELSPSSQP